MMRFDGKICLVTGAASGIGRATAQLLAARGGCVILVDQDEENGEQVAAQIAADGGQARFAYADVANATQVATAVALTIKISGSVDVLINNAAIMTFAPITDIAIEDWDRVFAVNLRSAFLFCKYCLPHMHHGAIVNVSSVHAHRTTANVVPYATSKGALEAFTRGLSVECKPVGVRVNAIVPGSVDTPMLWNNPNVGSGIEKLQLPISKPEDIAAAICFVASDDALAINGTCITADNGLLASLGSAPTLD